MKIFEKIRQWFAPLSGILAITGIAGAVLCTVAYILLSSAGYDPVGAGLTLLVVYICVVVLSAVISHFFLDRSSAAANGDDFHIDNFTLDMLLKLDDPVLICLENGKIIWKNREFVDVSGEGSISGKYLSDFVPVDLAELADEAANPDGMEFDAFGRKFRIHGYSVKSRMRKYIMVVWRDITELCTIRQRLEDEDVQVAFIIIDNIDELTRFTQGDYRAANLNVELILDEWAKSVNGVMREYEKNKFMFLFETRYLSTFIQEKFSVLDSVREVRITDGSVPVTLSIGTSRLKGTLSDKAKAAMSSLDIALQRGGDQAVVHTESGLDFYGGITKTVQKRTKVRARVIANELVSLISRSSNILVMGHSRADFDSFGACIGICRLAMFCGVPVNAVVNLNDPNIKRCLEKARRVPGYDNVFTDYTQAQDRLLSTTLLIIVDVNNPTQYESAELASNAAQTVYIDHHRKTGDLPETPVITYIEPSASSACELVSEILEQSIPSGMMSREEAELIFAGIMLDTKRFTVNAGTKTFSAAQYLRGEGADPMSIQHELFTAPLDDFKREANFGTNTIIYRSVIAISVNNRTDTTDDDRIAAAKTADKLLQVDGVSASFAIYRADNSVRISARSDGTINVQLILEKLDGGGHYDQAGTSIKGSQLEDAIKRLKEAIDGYLDAIESSQTNQ